MDGLRLSCLNSKELTFRSELKIKKEKQNIGFGPLEMLHAVLWQKYILVDNLDAKVT